MGDPIEQFLAERIGFCQQFSGTFAAMARSLGIPARVAVGFTWGDPVDGKPNTYRVTGRHAHAWPEVYFEGFGWVAFEPTPGRGAPGATHTGLDPRQDSPVEATPTTPTTVDPGSVVPPTLPDDFLVDPGFADTGDTTTATDPGFTIPWRLVAVVAALAAYCLGMPALARLRRARRWAAASTPAEQIEAIWSNLSDDLERNLRLTTSRADPPRVAERLIKDRRLPDEPLRRLGGLVTDARFAPAGSLDAAAVADAEADAEAVRTVIHRRVSRFQRWLRLLDPRWLISGTRRQAVVLASS
ncbi:MAG: transglutaminase-like domain-containing protein [Acidimicrobiales bacterium]